jgi:CheY-like chemotaxis protein
MVSANALREHVQQALDAGCDFHLSKPVTPSSLMQTLQRALELGETTGEIPAVAAKAT